MFLALTTLLSVMRIVALYQNYHASMDIWRDLNHMSYSEESSYKPGKVEKILKGSLGLIPSPLPLVKIEIMGRESLLEV